MFPEQHGKRDNVPKKKTVGEPLVASLVLLSVITSQDMKHAARSAFNKPVVVPQRSFGRQLEYTVKQKVRALLHIDPMSPFVRRVTDPLHAWDENQARVGHIG